MSAPDWDYWLNMPSVELWQAAFLSCGIDPYETSFRDIKAFGIGEDKVSKRLGLLIANHKNQEFFTYIACNTTDSMRHQVRLSECMVWALSLNPPWEIPKELLMIAKDAKSPSVMIDGRAAIPVRAIPFITGWGLSPLDIANHLARFDGAPFDFFNDVFAYHLQAGSPVKMLPKEWDSVRAELLALEAETRTKYEDETIGYAAWRKDSVRLLPAAVFVFKDEFERGWARQFQIAEYQEQREGEHALNYAPLLHAGMLQLALEGFGSSERKDWRELLKDKRVASKAPPPIKPVRGSPSPMKKARAQQQHAPDWTFWRLKTYVNDWAAAALSIGIDPDSLKHNPNAWMAGRGKTNFLGQSFIDDEQEHLFDKRYRLAMEWGRVHGDKVRHFNTDEIELKGFAAWAVENELPVPDEFANLLNAAQSVFKPGITAKPTSNLEFVERKDLIDGFKVESDEGENKQWWDNRFKSLSRNTPRWLADAIEDKKAGVTGSHLFNPALVAFGLLEEKKMTEKELLRVIRENPKFAPFVDQFKLCVRGDADA